MKMMYSESTLMPPTSSELRRKSNPNNCSISSVRLWRAEASCIFSEEIFSLASVMVLKRPKMSLSCCCTSSCWLSDSCNCAFSSAICWRSCSICPLISNTACSRAAICSDKSRLLSSSTIGSRVLVTINSRMIAPKPQQITSRKETLNSSIPRRLIMANPMMVR